MESKLEYKIITAKGIEEYLTATVSKTTDAVLLSHFSSIKNNKDFELFYRNNGDKVNGLNAREIKSMFLSSFGADGWKIVCGNTLEDTYVLMREVGVRFVV